MNIGKIEIVPIRQAFAHEAHNFTVWLEENIDALSNRIGIELSVIEREKSVGSFNVDLFCEDMSGNTVIIENQLERTDHDHLGKLLTYMVNLDAKTAIWVATEARPEHQRVIDWLNESTGVDNRFYFVQVEAIRIGDSPFAPLFTVLAQPDEQTHEIGEQKKELAERYVIREEFWKQLLEKSNKKTPLFSNRSPGQDYWLNIGAGKTGCQFSYHIRKDGALIDLYIDIGDFERNKTIFDNLYDQRETIEAEFGHSFDWRRLDDNRASRIIYPINGHGSLYETERWDTLQDIMIEAMINFDRVFRKRLRNLNV